jgi:SAM-dependent methyltransferase
MSSPALPACPFEPLDRLARFAWDWAPSLCDPSHGCQDYHRAWSLVRLLELGGAMPAGVPFFQRELGTLARAGRRRVLVSGGADTGLMAVVVSAFRAVDVVPEIVFADRCETTCMQNRLFARHLGLDAEIRRCDIVEIDCAPVDAVVAHSFLPFFEGAMRQRVIEAWARVARPGAVVLISNAIGTDESRWTQDRDPEKIEARRQTLEQQAVAAGWDVSTAAKAAETAARFWRSSRVRPPALTEANLRAGLERAGFEVRAFDARVRARAEGPSAMVFSSADTRPRAEVVAVRRP